MSPFVEKVAGSMDSVMGLNKGITERLLREAAGAEAGGGTQPCR